ncbi:hypothetical protein CcaCcLH18_13788 [Colletotrichum camelliae]|nr:hypothetical protein CcaCcLH18_13788 [Colletotrichum camelliae]
MSRDSSSNELRPFTEEDGRNASLQAEIPPTLPTPKKPVRHNFWLTKSAPITFALIFIACASALVGLSRYISRQNGLPLSITSIHYSWTYGPTAILVIILAGWKQADYQYKSMQPWWELVKGPSPASRSVLLDYLSPFQPLSCFEAFKNGHYVVAISVLNYFILKIIILISTTLFVVQGTLHKESIMIQYDNRFDIENMQNTLGFNIPESWVDFPIFHSPDPSAQADAPVWSYLAEINNVRADQSIPVHQSFILPSVTSNMSSISAPVDIFIPTVTCEEALLSVSYSEIHKTLKYHLNSSTCSVENAGDFSGDCQNNYRTSCEKSRELYQVEVVECLRKPAETTDSQVIFAIVFGNFTLENDTKVYVAAHAIQASSVLCKTGYEMVTATASQYLPDRQIRFPDSPPLSEPPRHVGNMTDRDFAYILSTILDTVSSNLMIASDMPDYSFIAGPVHAFLQLLTTSRKWTGDLDSLLQSPLVTEMSTEILMGMSKAFARTALLGEDSQQEPLEATAEISENRLHMRSYSLWPMVTGFILLSALCLILTFIIPQENTDLNITGSIASHAAVLATSPSLLSTLRNAVAVLRPVLECIALPQGDIVATLKTLVVLVGDEYRPEERQHDLITLKMKVSPGCSDDPTEKEHVTTELDIEENEISDYMWVGQNWNLDVNSGSFEQPCPSVGFLFGKLGSRTTTGVLDTRNLTALFCSQGIEEFPATVTYMGNPEDIHLGDVRFHPEKSRAIHNEMDNGTSFNFRPKLWFWKALTYMPSAYNDGIHFNNDEFFDHVMFGPESLSLEDLVGPENIQNLTNAVSHNYREFIAHILDHNFRSEIWTPINGVSWQITTRISIHRTSKVVLQALLAAMTVLGLIGYKLVKLRGTLPRNPCSIASTMGFLADSQLCDPDAGIIPADAGTTSERELGQSLGGYVFSLGWWEEVGDKSKNTTASPRDGELGEPGVVGESEVSRRRHFGIDVGQAYALGFAGKDKE